MKTDDTNLQPSAKLAAHVAPYRDQASLVSTTQIDAMLAHRDQLPNRSLSTIRKFAMTIAALSAIALVLYQAFLSSPNSKLNVPKSNKPFTLHLQQQSAIPESAMFSRARQTNAPVTAPTPKTQERPPFAAPGDQTFADLTPAQLARLGIVVTDDTIAQYNLNRKGDATSMKLTAHYFEGEEKSDIPIGITVSSLSPVIMTQADGHGAAFHREDTSGVFTWEMTGDDQKHYEEAQSYLKGAKTPGLHILSFGHKSVRLSISPDVTIRKDTVSIEIGRDVAAMPLVNLAPPAELPDSVREALNAMALYFKGSGSKPQVNWPQNFVVLADTVTAFDLIKRFDEENTAEDKVFIRQTLARLNELIPVLVRVGSGNGKPSPKDFIFWYEPSEELFAALPASQAALFRKPALSNHCLRAPNTVAQDATITYCASEPQRVAAIVRDLTGHVIRIVLADAHAGDNTLHLPTEVLGSGLYLVTIRMKDGSEQTRRIWVENHAPLALPRNGPEELTSYEDHLSIITFPATYEATSLRTYLEQPVTFDNSLLDSATNLTPEERLRIQQAVNLSEKQLSDVHNAFASYKPSLDSLVDVEEQTIKSAGLQYLELTQPEALRLGIEAGDSAVRFYLRNPHSSTVPGFDVARLWGVRLIRATTSEIAHPLPMIIPSIVTDGMGRKRLTTTSTVDDSTVNTLVPIVFISQMQSDTLGARDLIFWYKPTSELLNALPDSARTYVERNVLLSNAQSHPSDDRAMSLHKIHMYPNPSKGTFTLDLTLDAPRQLSVIVRNLLGQERARTVINAREGESSPRLNFTSLDEGIYILEITTDTGESQFERLVIEH